MSCYILSRISLVCEEPGCLQQEEFEVSGSDGEGEPEVWDKIFAAGWGTRFAYYCPQHWRARQQGEGSISDGS